MMQLIRDRTKSAIPQEFYGQRRCERELQMLQARCAWLAAKDPTMKFDYFKSSLWKAARSQLGVETCGSNVKCPECGGSVRPPERDCCKLYAISITKCAYCEKNIEMSCEADVDHFRPKSLYWWLGLCYENYVFSCKSCNQLSKSDQFPIQRAQMKEPSIKHSSTERYLKRMVGTFAPDPLADDATLTRAAFEQALKNEDADLVHPYIENPEEFFKWTANKVNKVEICPRHTRGRKMERALSTISVLGLNRETLRNKRWKTWNHINLLCGGLSLNNDPTWKKDTFSALEQAVGGAGPFTAMSRYLIREVNRLEI